MEENSKTEYQHSLKQEFWDDFYKKLKDEASELEYFEWYAGFSELKDLLKKYLSKEDSILNVGCGKSLLSENMYDEGYQNITNIDYSESIISHMKSRIGSRDTLKYEVGDVNSLKYGENYFSTIIDKGTLDAIYPTINEKEKVYGYLNSCFNAIKDKEGKIIIVSLLQIHVLSLLIQYSALKNAKLTIEEIETKDGKLNPFFCILEKNTEATDHYFHLNFLNNSFSGITGLKCIEEIRNRQSLQIFENQSKKLSPGDRFIFKLFEKKNESIVRYTLIVVDSPSNQILKKNTCGVFVTPKNKETGYMFGNEDGNFELLEQTSLSRLIIANLSPFCEYGDIEAIKAELNPYVSKFIPDNCENLPCPYFTDSEENEPREIIFQGKTFFVDEVEKEEEGKFRRLIAYQSQSQIQSQVKLRDNGKIDWGYIDFETHRLALISLAYASSIAKDQPEILILGSAAQVFPTFAKKCLPKANVTCVDCENEAFEIAQKHFESSEKGKNFSKDAENFVKDTLTAGRSFDFVFIDINNNDESLNCPPDEFCEKSFLENLSKIVNSKGVALFNCIFREESSKESFILNLIGSGFEGVYEGKCEEERNFLIMAQKIEFPQHEGKLVIDEELLLSQSILLENYKRLEKESDLKWDSTLNIDQLVSNFQVIFPKASGAFTTSGVLVKNERGDITSATKEQYLSDQTKIDKKAKKKSKKKGR